MSIIIHAGWYKGEYPTLIKIELLQLDIDNNCIDVLTLKIAKFIISISIGGLYQ